MITCQNLRREFGSVIALEGLSLEVSAGEVFGLVGPDGAGKTTAMRLLTGILEQSSGTATVAGFDTARQSDQLKEHIGYMSQRFGLYPDLTVRENILFYADIYGVPRRGREEKIQQLLGFSNLAPFEKRHAGNLSGGMKQKLGLACALIHTPRVLFLDEPTNGVDPVSRRDFWRILYQLVRQGVTLVISTAYLDEAERCGRVALLDKGKLLALGTPAEVKDSMNAVVLTVACERVRQATSVLRQAFPALSVGIFGDRIHVAVRGEGADGVERRIHEVLAENHLTPASVERAEPSLEDVFVAMLKEAP